MKNFQRFLMFIFITSIFLYQGEVECRGSTGGGGRGGSGGGRGGWRSGSGRSRSYGGAGGIRSGSSSGPGSGDNGYLFLIVPGAAILLFILITCYKCIQIGDKKNRQPTGQIKTNFIPYVHGKCGYNVPVQNNLLQFQGSKIPETKIPIHASNVYIPRVHSATKPARQYGNVKIPVKKKPEIFIL